MRKLIAVAMLALAGASLAACNPNPSLRDAIQKDPVLRWQCKTADGSTFYTNNTGKAELPPAIAAKCVAIDAVRVHV